MQGVTDEGTHHESVRSSLACCRFEGTHETEPNFGLRYSPLLQIVLGRRIPLVDKIGGAPNGVGRWAPIAPLLGRIRVGTDLLQEHQSTVTPTWLIRLGTFGNLCEIL